MEESKKDVNNESVTASKEQVKGNSFSISDWISKTVIRLGVVFMILWQFDGLWLSGNPDVNSFLRNNFPEKYRDEQLKLSRFNENNEYISQLERNLNVKLAIAEQAILDKDIMENNAQLKRYEFETLCRYYGTSVLMFSHLAHKYSERELNQVVSCTNQECFDIMNSTEKAKLVCENT